MCTVFYREISFFFSVEFEATWREVSPFSTLPPLVEINQRVEPPHFIRAFSGRLIFRLPPPPPPPVMSSPRPSGAASTTTLLSPHPPVVVLGGASRHLLQVRHGYAIEVAGPAALCPHDVYLLLTVDNDEARGDDDASSLWIWVGPRASTQSQVSHTHTQTRTFNPPPFSFVQFSSSFKTCMRS